MRPLLSTSLGVSVPGLEVRRAARRRIGAVETSAVLKANADWRFHYTVKDVFERGEIWFACQDDGTLLELRFADSWIPVFWPHEDIGTAACRRLGWSCRVEPMPLDHWLDGVLDQELRPEGRVVMLCPAGSRQQEAPKTIDEIVATLTSYWMDRDAFWAKHFAGDRLIPTMSAFPGPGDKLP